MSVDKELRDFIAQPENLRTALEVSHHVARLRREFHKDFWAAHEAELRTRLENSPHAKTWYVEKSKRDYKNAWAGHGLTPALQLTYPDLGFLRTIIQQNTPGTGYSLYYGILWSQKHNQRTELMEYKALTTYLVQQGQEVRDEGRWVIVKTTGYGAGKDRFALRMSADRENFIRQMVDFQWVLFMDTVQYLNALNKAILSDTK